jgi:outer membrane usher protein
MTAASSRCYRPRSRTSTQLACTAVCLAIAVALPAWAAETPSTTAMGAHAEMMVVRINLNTENKGDLFVHRSLDLDFFLKLEDLKAMGFKDPRGSVLVLDGAPHVSLRSIRGVSFIFDERTLALNITAEAQLLPSSSLGLRAERRRGQVVGSANSAFVNYAVNASGGTGVHTGLGFAGEAGVRLGDYLFLSDGSTVETGAGKKFVRLMSSVTRDDREHLRRIIVGDLLTPTRDLSSSVNLGGVGITKVYGLDPYFVRFPTQSLSGSVALPSDLEVYVDGQRVRAEKLKPGEFELRDILAYGGAKDVQLVLRDAFGRVQQLNYSLYFSDQPLQQGLHEYSYNFGALRRRFGLQSNAYGPAALTFFHRYGVSGAITLGWRGEATRRLLNTGPMATVVLGNLGVANLALARTAIARGQGSAALASYSYQAKKWSLGLFLRQDSAAYASLGDPPSMTNRKYEGGVAATYRLAGGGSVSLSHTALSVRPGTLASTASPAQPYDVFRIDSRRASTLGLTIPIGSGRTLFTASLSHIKSASQRSRNEVTLGLNILLGKDYTAAANFRGDRDGHTESVRFTKNQPIAEGLGYMVSLDHSGGSTDGTDLRSNIQYNAPAAILRADSDFFRDHGQTVNNQRLSVAGGAVFVGGHGALTRPVTESYAIVKVGEVPDVGILVDGQQMGKTNKEGLLVLPALSPYYENSVSVAAGELSMEYSLAAAVKRVSPALRSGAFVDFAVIKTQAFTGKLKSRQGPVAKAVEFREVRLNVGGKPQDVVTGHGGEFYIENLKPGTYAGTVTVEGKLCVFDLSIPQSNETFVELGELVCAARP